MRAAIRSLGLAGLLACTRKESPSTAPAPPPAPAPSPSVVASTRAPSPRSAAPEAGAAAHCTRPPTSGEGIARSHDGAASAWAEDEPGVGDDVNGKSWLCFERAGQRKVLLTNRAGRPDAGVEDELNDFADLVFSRDDRVVFFATSAWAVSTAAHGVEVATGKEWFIVDGSIVEELDHGPFKGSLHATHFRLDDQHPVGSPGYTGRGVVQTVVDWRGKKLRRLPDDDDARRRVLDGK